VARLKERELVTAKEAADFTPRVKLEIKDYRQLKSPPLPELAE